MFFKCVEKSSLFGLLYDLYVLTDMAHEAVRSEHIRDLCAIIKNHDNFPMLIVRHFSQILLHQLDIIFCKNVSAMQYIQVFLY